MLQYICEPYQGSSHRESQDNCLRMPAAAGKEIVHALFESGWALVHHYTVQDHLNSQTQTFDIHAR